MATLPLPARFVDEAAALLGRRTGLVIGESRHSAFETSLVEAMLSARVANPVVYLADLAATPTLMDDLAGRVTIGETYFFRDPEQFALIEREILPALLGPRAPDSRPLRIWSAGCATGEEPYTLAILASRLGAAGRTRIVGTDISRRALSRARRARYTRWSLRGVPPDMVDAHFLPVGDRFELRRTLRDAVSFRSLNLADDTYPSSATGIVGMDLILCRNVLIYFDRETIARVAARLVASLAPDGWLVLGASDPPLGDVVPCEVVVTGAGLIYRRPGAPAMTPPVPRLSLPPADWREEPIHLEPDVLRLEVEEPAKADGGDAASPVVLVRALANRGELAEAERACAAALERDAMSAELQCLHALLLNQARRYDAAAVAARKALYLGRELAMAHLANGAALAGLGDSSGARRAFATAARQLAGLPPDAVVPASGGELAGRLADLAQVEVELLAEAAV
jgi:chemotaxis protein methyltransferase CheR